MENSLKGFDLKGKEKFNTYILLTLFLLFASNDNIPELDESFVYRLIAVNNQARRSGVSDPAGAATTVSLTILENDHPYGIFSIDANASGSGLLYEPSEGSPNTRTYTIRRSAGLFAAITVTWSFTSCQACDVVQLSGCLPCTGGTQQDFSPSQGSIVFAEGQSSAPLTVSVVDDLLPEYEERFVLTLLSVSGAAELASGSGNTSVGVDIAGSDFPYGLFSIAFDSAASAYLSLNTSGRAVLVAEQQSVLRFTITRAMGTNGQVTAAWAAQSVTAQFADGDFTPAGGSVVFNAGELTKSVSVTINNDDIPEIDELFRVVLSSVSGGATVDITQASWDVTIDKNDDYNGLFGFDPLVKAEDVTEASGTLVFNITRTRGLFGSASLQWSIDGNDDFTQSSGTVNFADGQSVAQISLTVLQDQIPEPTKQWIVVLTGLGQTAVRSADQNIFITVAASDEPHGSKHSVDTQLCVCVFIMEKGRKNVCVCVCGCLYASLSIFLLSLLNSFLPLSIT